LSGNELCLSGKIAFTKRVRHISLTCPWKFVRAFQMFEQLSMRIGQNPRSNWILKYMNSLKTYEKTFVGKGENLGFLVDSNV
jgi:hypothetical protein